MNPKKRFLLLTVIMSTITLIVEVISFGTLYQTAISEEKVRLEETAKSQARLIEAVARFNSIYSNDYPHGAWQATLSQVRNAHSEYTGFGNTGEFTLSKRIDDSIVFLLSHRHHDLNDPKPVPWESDLAAPMRLALSGQSGSIIGLDYRGAKVLAAFEPVAELGLGIVAKIDLLEIRAPFVKAAVRSSVFAIILIAIGVSLFYAITNPLIKGLYKTVDELETAINEVKTLRGILPICSFCKKIREDNGYWSQVEVYVKNRSDADFSHGICPDCMEENYSEMLKTMKKGAQGKNV